MRWDKFEIKIVLYISKLKSKKPKYFGVTPSSVKTHMRGQLLDTKIGNNEMNMLHYIHLITLTVETSALIPL